METLHAAQPAVTAIVCTISRPHAVVQCVRSLLATTYAPFSVVVVDQSAGEEIAVALQPVLSADARLQHLRTPVAGKTRAQNLAIAASDADIFVFTDDDCTVPPDWVPTILATFCRLPGACLLFGEVHPPVDHDWATSFSPSMAVSREQQLRPSFLPRVNYLYGCCMAVRRRAFERIGLFDETLGPGGALAEANEEVDFHLRALRARPPLGVYLTPAFHVEHTFGSRPQGEPTRRLLRTYEMGKSAMLTKHMLRGDLGAACQLIVWAFAPFLHGALSLVRAGRPRGVGMIVPYLTGIARGMRLARGVSDPSLTTVRGMHRR